MNQTKLVGIIIGSIFGSLLIISSIVKIFFNYRKRGQEDNQNIQQTGENTEQAKRKAQEEIQEERLRKIEDINKKLRNLKIPNILYQKRRKEALNTKKSLEEKLNELQPQQIQQPTQQQVQKLIQQEISEIKNNQITDGLSHKNKYINNGNEREEYFKKFKNFKKWISQKFDSITTFLNDKKNDEKMYQKFFNDLANELISYLYWILIFKNDYKNNEINEIIEKDINFILDLWNNIITNAISGFNNGTYIINTNEIITNKGKIKLGIFSYKNTILRFFKRSNPAIAKGGKITKKQRKTRKNKK